uniref:Uncharacterized protein n=1 Tax=Leersia perrieri TaxID=77586 RepID=A0A0D9X7U9_9ORYZ
MVGVALQELAPVESWQEKIGSILAYIGVFANALTCVVIAPNFVTILRDRGGLAGVPFHKVSLT